MNRDTTIFELIEKEHQRQLKGIELIASENFVSDQVMEAMGSYLTNKYAEGYPGHRYYGGCQVVDEVEQLAIDRVCKLFGAEYANVQPHSGAQANAAVLTGNQLNTLQLALMLFLNQLKDFVVSVHFLCLLGLNFNYQLSIINYQLT